MIIKLLKENKTTVSELAKKLGVSACQIRAWDKKGILESNPHWPELHEMFPELKPRQPTLTKKGLEDKRYNSGRKRKELILSPTSIPSYVESAYSKVDYPNIKFVKKSK